MPFPHRRSVATLLLLAAVTTSVAQPMRPAPGASGAPGAAKSAPAKNANITVITVGTTSIKAGRIDSLAMMMARARGADLASLPAEQVMAVRRAVATTLIGQELVELEAKARKTQVSPGEIDTALKALKAQFPDAATWREAVRKSGDTEAQVRARIARQLRADKVLATAVTPPRAPDETELRAFWEKHKKQFPVNDSLRALQILVLADSKTPGDVAATKKKKLEALRRELAEDTAETPVLLRRFMEAAARNGEGPEARNGGDLERFHPGDFHPDFQKEAARLRVGEMSPVFRTPLGYHLVLLIEKYDGKFESYRLQSLQNLMAQKGAEAAEDVRGFLKKLAGKYPVKYVRPEYRDLSESGIY